VSDIRLPSPAATTPVRVAAGTSAEEALRAAGVPLTGPGAAVVVRDAAGTLRDLAWAPEADAEVAPVAMDSDQGRAVLRHSAAHVLAQAVQDLFPGTLLGIGPPVENGFYYDFAPHHPFRPEDLERIEKRMQEIIKAAQRFHRRPISDDQARVELSDETFKLELIELKGAAGAAEGAEVEVGAGQLTMYDNLDAKTGERVWTDLCRGPHLPTTRNIPAVKLMRSAAAYWRGSEKNPQLQRIYGTAWESRDALKSYLTLLAEAERRDHRRLGAELDLFSFPDVIGSGLAVWHPKGGVVRRVIEEYSRRKHEDGGYDFVYTPHLTRSTLFEISGHLDWYAEGMYPPMQMEGADYYMKPMNCPMHIQIYAARGRSYRELPLRLFEFGTVYRFEKSGVIHGLTRARGFTQDDAHIFCTPEQLQDELAGLLKFTIDMLRDFGLTEFTADLSTRPEKKYVGELADWAVAEAALEEALKRAGVPYQIAAGEGAFYAPKIDVHVKDAIGRRWQLSTLQVDFQLPPRFEIEYQAADGTRKRPYMLHRALLGSEERFFGILLEHYAGAFPAWLAPVQVVGIPVTDDQVGYLREVAARLKSAGVRVEVDDSDDRMQKKIRNAQKQKVPFMLIAGEQDQGAGAVSFRFRDGTQWNGVPVADAVAHVAATVESRTNEGPTAPTGSAPTGSGTVSAS
jgi:threonyl-tRNA synthetase